MADVWISQSWVHRHFAEMLGFVKVQHLQGPEVLCARIQGHEAWRLSAPTRLVGADSPERVCGWAMSSILTTRMKAAVRRRWQGY
eukprot:6205695-Pleurochrysis_carterae.AAC.1